MPSVGTFRAQPVTRTFTMTQNENEGDNGAYYFRDSTVAAWLANNASNLTAVGNLITIPEANLTNVIDNLNSNGRFSNRKSLLDMGKEIVIGNEINSRMIVLRRVQGQNEGDEGGLGGVTAYICVENNNTDTSSNRGRFTVRVARI
jgi:hypothetical protein